MNIYVFKSLKSFLLLNLDLLNYGKVLLINFSIYLIFTIKTYHL
uniref:Uncharacterized protein n=1 Tax=Myoviridae sp. ctgsk7 TaxID=2825151 RepID=A0A8S5PX84_9CAUD|nr:MAG TPA: hypothetical protein [Myoviridae sp. ctgsk7]